VAEPSEAVAELVTDSRMDGDMATGRVGRRICGALEPLGSGNPLAAQKTL